MPIARSTALEHGTVTYDVVDALGGCPLIRGEGFAGVYRPHVHSTYIVGVVDRGALEVRTATGRFVAHAGSVVILNPFDVSDKRAAEGAPWSFCFVHVPVDVLTSISRRGSMSGGVWFPEPVVDDPALAGGLLRAYDSLRDRPRHATTESDFSVFMRDLVMRHGRSDRHAATIPDGIRRARARLLTHSDGPVTLDALAELASLSRFHFARTFRRAIGLPPYEYHEQVRVARCKDMLHAGAPLRDITYAVGFADQSHFTRDFARSAGVTPGQYAAMVRHPGCRIRVPAPRRRMARTA